ncbi:hypothetical protein, partial [Paraburkholderia xenovorans]|uniref:hypothetical protein n=1 Tax=Paraburkholderia xenovorans TaxID=36873 RepID=UPI0038BA6876
MAEEQQRADLAIQLAGFGEFGLQALDIGGQRRIGGQDVAMRSQSENSDKYYYVNRNRSNHRELV